MWREIERTRRTDFKGVSETLLQLSCLQNPLYLHCFYPLQIKPRNETDSVRDQRRWVRIESH
ncbi:unnamed protein product [Brassica oleracea var. botrytis]